MEKIITCSLHKGYSHFASKLADKSLIGKKVNVVLNVKKKTIKFINKDDYKFTYILPTMRETIPLTYIKDHIKERSGQKRKGTAPDKPGQLDQALFILSYNPKTKEPTNVSEEDLYFEAQNVFTFPTTEKPIKMVTQAFYYVSKISLGKNKFSIVVQERDYDLKNLKILPIEPKGFKVIDFEGEENF